MTGHVLLVDDSTTIRMVLAAELREAKFRVTAVPTLDGARRALAQSREQTPIDLAILDLHLPDGDGFELLEEMRKDPAFAALPVMILSSDVRFDARLRSLGIGADDFVGKPHSKAYLVSRAQMLTGAAKRKTEPSPPSFRVVVVDSDSAKREMLAKALRVCHGADVVSLDNIEQAAQYLEYQGVAVEGVIVERRCYLRMLGLIKERCPADVPVIMLDDVRPGQPAPKALAFGPDARAPLAIPRSVDATTIAEIMHKRLVETTDASKCTSSRTIPKGILADVRNRIRSG